MIVCHCRVVTDRAIRAAVEAGAQDTDAVGAHCGAGEGCGACLPSVEQLLADAALAIRSPGRLVEQHARRRGVLPSPVAA